MPYKRDFVQANRYDLARVVERYGGLYELAEKLGFQARYGIHDNAADWRIVQKPLTSSLFGLRPSVSSIVLHVVSPVIRVSRFMYAWSLGMLYVDPRVPT